LKRQMSLSRRRTLNRVMLGIASLVLAVFVGLSYRQWEQYHQASVERGHSREISAAINSVLTTLTDAETGQRGFLLTGEGRYLEPYHRALQELPNELATLRKLFSGRRGADRDVDQLTTLANTKLDELRKPIEVRRTRGLTPAVAVVLTDEGKRTMDSFRALCSQMQRDENVNLARASADQEAAAGIALLVTVAGSLVLLFLFAFGFEPFASPDPQAWQRSWLIRYGAAILAVVAIALIRGALTPLIGPTSFPFTRFFCAVIFAAWFGGFRPAVLAIALSILAADWFFAAPTRTLRISGRDDQIAALVLVIVGFGTALLSRSQRSAVDRALRAENSERNERQRFETTLGSIGDAVIATDPDGRITLMNRVAEELTGWTIQEAQNRPLSEVFRIVNQETRKTVEDPVEKVRRLTQVVGLANHTILISRSGQEFAIDDSGAPILRPDGSLAGVVLVFRDVTDSRRAEERLTEQAALLEQAWAAIIVSDEAGTIKYWNPAAENLYGWARDEAIGRISHELLRTEFPASLQEVMQQSQKDGHWQGELVHTCKDGRRVTVLSRWAVLPGNDSSSARRLMEINLDISERKIAEQQLAERKEELAALVEGMPSLVWIAQDAQCSKITGNAASARLFGTPLNQNVSQTPSGESVLPILHFDATGKELPPHELPMQRAGATGKTVENAELQILLPDGRRVWILGNATPLFAPDGKVRGVIGAFFDITERMRAEQQIEEQATALKLSAAESRSQHERFHGIIDSAMDAIITIDESQHIQVFNRAAEQVFRCSASDALGQPLEKLLPERFRGAHQNHIEMFGRSGITTRSMLKPGTLWGRRADGEEFPLEASISQIEQAGKKLFTVILRDITERKRAESELQIERERLSLALKTGRMGVYEVDLARNVLWLSPESYSLLGTTPHDFAPTPEAFVEIVHPQDRELLVQHIKGSIETHEVINHEFRISRPDGKECWVSCQGQIEYNEAGRPLRHSGLLLDITSRKQIEQMVRRFERLSAAARLSAAMAHEINNPLAGVVNLTYLAKIAPGISDAAVELLTGAEQELERVAHAARQTLGFYRESTSPERIDVPSLVESVLELCSAKLISKHISIQRAFGECTPIYGVRGEIRQAISNVIANAIDAVPKGGAIVIGIHSVPGDKEGAAEIVIADNGPGIAVGDIDNVFEPFFTTKGGTGMGLGLWVTRDIVERHGGTITVSTREDESELRGANVTIRLPHAPRLRRNELKTPATVPSKKKEPAMLEIEDGGKHN
jgi:two-component system, sporulation sensor kinase E